jgi:hypothetical protein
MDRRASKELLHIAGWLARVDEIVQRARTPTSVTAFSRRPVIP